MYNTGTYGVITWAVVSFQWVKNILYFIKILNAFSGQKTLHLLFRYVSKFANGVLICKIWTNFSKIFVKVFGFEWVLVMNLIPRLILFGNFCHWEEFLSIASFVTDRVIFILFLYFIIKLEKWSLLARFLICSDKFL